MDVWTMSLVVLAATAAWMVADMATRGTRTNGIAMAAYVATMAIMMIYAYMVA